MNKKRINQEKKGKGANFSPSFQNIRSQGNFNSENVIHSSKRSLVEVWTQARKETMLPMWMRVANWVLFCLAFHSSSENFCWTGTTSLRWPNTSAIPTTSSSWWTCYATRAETSSLKRSMYLRYFHWFLTGLSYILVTFLPFVPPPPKKKKIMKLDFQHQ